MLKKIDPASAGSVKFDAPGCHFAIDRGTAHAEIFGGLDAGEFRRERHDGHGFELRTLAERVLANPSDQPSCEGPQSYDYRAIADYFA